jgi:hypothetical protein
MFYYFCKNFPVNKCFPILFRGPVYFLFMFTFRQIGNPVSCRLWLKNLIKENIYAALSISFVCSLSRRLEIQSLVAYDWRILLARTFILTLVFSYFKPYILKLVCFFGFYWYSILCKKKLRVVMHSPTRGKARGTQYLTTIFIYGWWFWSHFFTISHHALVSVQRLYGVVTDCVPIAALFFISGKRVQSNKNSVSLKYARAYLNASFGSSMSGSTPSNM